MQNPDMLTELLIVILVILVLVIIYYFTSPKYGALAQMGARLTGSQEVRSSSLLSSTKQHNNYKRVNSARELALFLFTTSFVRNMSVNCPVIVIMVILSTAVSSS